MILILYKTLASAIILSSTLSNANIYDTVKEYKQKVITIHQEEINGDKAKELEIETERKKKEELERKRKEERRKKEAMENDIYWLSKIICGENHDGSDKCKIFTGSVVLNRVKSKHYPNTIKEVIYQRGQYASTHTSKFYNPCKKCKKIAKELLENGSQLPNNVLYQAMFPQSRGIYAHIGTEYFCY